jgi:two-component system LytT family response regulator
MKKISALIVDDEPLARERIRSLLNEDPDVCSIIETADGLEASQAIRENQPDVIFLDVQIPELDGFEVLQKLDAIQTPAVIIVTAHGEYAIRAFEVRVVDYLLKPFDRQRFSAALGRAKERVWSLPMEVLSNRLLRLLDSNQFRSRGVDRLVVKENGRILFVRLEEVDWIESAGNYVKLYVGSKCHMLRQTMNSIETRLDPALFLRIHRSVIVNIERIKQMEPCLHGDYRVVLADGRNLTLSKSYRDRLELLLGGRL